MKDKLLGNKKLLIAGAVAAGILLLGGVAAFTMHQQSIKQTKDEITLEAGAPLEVEVKDFFDTAEANYKKIELDTSAVDTKNVGEYDIKAVFRDKEYVIKVKVQDTTVPEVTLKERYVYMSDLKAPVDIEYEYYDATEVTMTLAGTEKIQGLEDITEKKVKILTDIIKVPGDQDRLGKITSITDEEGILRGVLKFEDTCGNFQLEEIVIVYDRPDGVKPSEETEKSDEKTDGNKEDGTADDKKTDSSDKKPSSNGTTGNTEDSDKGNSGSSGGTTTPSTPSEPEKPEEPTKPSEPEIEEPESHMTPAMQSAVNAGYYNVIPTSSGGYVVMVRVGESQKGHELIKSYLDSIGMEPTGGYGCLISAENDQYMCGVGANEYREKTHGDDPNHPDFWD